MTCAQATSATQLRFKIVNKNTSIWSIDLRESDDEDDDDNYSEDDDGKNHCRVDNVGKANDNVDSNKKSNMVEYVKVIDTCV